MSVHRHPPSSPHPVRKPVRPAHPALAALLARWQAYAGNRPMPDRADLDFLNLKPWRGHLLLMDVFSHGRQFQTAPSGGDLANPGSAIAAVIASRAALDTHYEQVVAQRHPAVTTIAAREDTATPAVDIIMLPLAGADGLTTALLVGAYEKAPWSSADDADQGRSQKG